MAGEGIIKGILLCYFYSLQKIYLFGEKVSGDELSGNFFDKENFVTP